MRQCFIAGVLVLIVAAIAANGDTAENRNQTVPVTTAPDTQPTASSRPHIHFYGVPQRVTPIHTDKIKTVVFVCDASGSMMQSGRMDILKTEYTREINRMKPIQSFNIIFYQEAKDELGYVAFKPGLAVASLRNQDAVGKFLKDVSAHGPRSPIKALDEAFEEKPQLIVFLVGGEFDAPGGPNDDQVLAYFRQKITDHQTHVSTVLFLQNKKEVQDAGNVAKALKTVAEENGGTFKATYADDFADH